MNVKYKSSILVLTLCFFSMDCRGNQLPHKEELLKAERIESSPIQGNQKMKSYLPVQVTWDMEKEIHVGQPTLLRVTISVLQDSESLQINIILPEELLKVSGETSKSLGNLSAGSKAVFEFVVNPIIRGDHQFSVHISRLESGQRQGMAIPVSLSTAEESQKYPKPERVVEGKNGETYYQLPEARTEVIPGAK